MAAYFIGIDFLLFDVLASSLTFGSTFYGAFFSSSSSILTLGVLATF
jgi:hypothetical protein